MFLLLLFLTSILYFTLRLVNLPLLLTFHFDQGVHLLQAYNLVDSHQFTLLGPAYIAKMYQGRSFFVGPQYTYFLSLLGVLTSWNPLTITICLIILEFLLLLLFTFWLKRHFSPLLSLLPLVIITTQNFFVVNSRFIWNPHFLLPLGLIAVVALYHFFSTRHPLFLALFSFFWGLAYSFHFTALLWILPLLVVLFLLRHSIKLVYLFIVPIFFIIGDLPYFIFELRHSFYNHLTLFLALTQPGAAQTEPHHLIYPLIPFILFALVSLLSHLPPRRFLIISTVIILLNLASFLYFRPNLPYGHPPDWNYPLEQQVVDLILGNGCPQNYNIATTLSTDTRASDLRFLLAARHCPPQAFDQYPQSATLFLVAPATRPPQSDTVWEITSLRPFRINSTIPLTPVTTFYRLDRL